MRNLIEELPEQLLNSENVPNDVSILIGENGSGKSTLLNELSEYFLSNGKQVISIANSIHDKFVSGHKNFRTLRHRSGRKQTKNTIKLAFENVSKSGFEIQKLKNASIALQYIGFDPVFGFRIKGYNESYRDALKDSNPYTTFSLLQRDRILSILDQAIINTDSNKITWIRVESFDYGALMQSAMTELFLWESILRKMKIIDRIEVFLRKNKNDISLYNASSGELAMITSIVYISKAITDNTVLLIDEPENSLHPKWQKEYVKNLLDLFYFYQPKIVIATHAPLIVNGAELNKTSPKIYKSEEFTFQLQTKDALNVEEILYRYFDLTTPQNRFLSEHLVRYLNLLANNKINLDGFTSQIRRIESYSFDPVQQEVLKGILNIASDIFYNNNKQ